MKMVDVEKPMREGWMVVDEETKAKILGTKSVQDWLDECRTPKTRRTYESRIATFFATIKMPIKDFLKLDHKEKRHIALKFQNQLCDKNPNSVGGVLTALNSYLWFLDMKIDFHHKKVKGIPDLTSHNFSNGDLGKMFDAADTKEKALLSLGCSLGWEISAVLGDLDRKTLSSLVERARSENVQFIYFDNVRHKTGVRRIGVLNPLALEWLEKWLIESRDAKPRKRKQVRVASDVAVSDVFDLTPEGVNKMLRVLARKAHIVVTGRVHFHSLRGWVMSGLSRAGFNVFQIKYLVGKAIAQSDETYLKTLRQEIEERYPEAYERYLNVKPLVPIKTVTDLRRQIEEQQKELESLCKSSVDIEELKRKVDFYDKFVNVSDTVETKEDAERLLDFLNRMRLEKAREART